MMRKVILVLLLLCAGVLQAQQLTVTDFRTDPSKNDAVAFPKEDFNGDRCGLVKLKLNMFEVALEGDIVSSEYRNDEWWIYMIREANWLTIKSKKNDFVPLRCEFGDFQIDGIESDMTYVMNVELPSPPEVADKDVAEANGGSKSFGSNPQQVNSGRSSYSPYSYGRTMQPNTTSRTSSSSSYNNNLRNSSSSSNNSNTRSSSSGAYKSNTRVSSSTSNNSSSRSSSSGSYSGSRSSSSRTAKASGSSNTNSSNGRSQSVSPQRSSGSTNSRGSSTVNRSSSSSNRSSSSSCRSSNASTSRGSSSSRGSK